MILLWSIWSMLDNSCPPSWGKEALSAAIKRLLIFQTVHGWASSLLAGTGHLQVPSSAQIRHSKSAVNLTQSTSDHLKKIPFIWGLPKNFFTGYAVKWASSNNLSKISKRKQNSKRVVSVFNQTFITFSVDEINHPHMHSASGSGTRFLPPNPSPEQWFSHWIQAPLMAGVLPCCLQVPRACWVQERHMPGAGTSLPNLRDGKNLHVATSHRARVTYLREQRRGAPVVHRQEMKMAPQGSHCSF